MCTQERPQRDDEMLGVGVVESDEKIESQREREREREGGREGVRARSKELRRAYSDSPTSKRPRPESDLGAKLREQLAKYRGERE